MLEGAANESHDLMAAFADEADNKLDQDLYCFVVEFKQDV